MERERCGGEPDSSQDRLKETGHMSFHGPASNVTVREHGNQGLPLKEGAVFLLKLKSLIKFEFNQEFKVYAGMLNIDHVVSQRIKIL